MRVLVAYATRHGATAGIADHIAATLIDQGLGGRFDARRTGDHSRRLRRCGTGRCGIHVPLAQARREVRQEA